FPEHSLSGRRPGQPRPLSSGRHQLPQHFRRRLELLALRRPRQLDSGLRYAHPGHGLPAVGPATIPGAITLMQNGNFNLITRRAFLDRSLKTSMAVALSTLVDIPFVMKRALAEGSIGLNGKKVLFIWLRGANDALNSVIPA